MPIQPLLWLKQGWVEIASVMLAYPCQIKKITIYFLCNDEWPLWTLKHHPEMLNAVIAIKGHQSPGEWSLPQERASLLEGKSGLPPCATDMGQLVGPAPAGGSPPPVLAMPSKLPPSRCLYFFWCQYKVGERRTFMQQQLSNIWTFSFSFLNTD